MSTHDPYGPQQPEDPQQWHRSQAGYAQEQGQSFGGQHFPGYPDPQQPGSYAGHRSGFDHPADQQQRQGQPYAGGYAQQQGQPYGGGYTSQAGPGYPGQQQPGSYGYPQQGYGYPHAAARNGSQPGVPAGFGEAIKRMYAQYAQFSGRASRSEYWWVALYFGAVYLVLSVLMAADTNSFGETGALGSLMAVLLGLFTLGHLVPSIAIGVRRLHDVNMSGWFMLLGLIPYAGGLVLLVFAVLPSRPEGARFDR